MADQTRPRGYVDADYLRRMAEWLAPIKRRSFELMRVSAGQRVLDVGCGPGVDTTALARIVGPSGHVTGIDIDPGMIEQASAAARQAGVDGYVEYRVVDGHSPPFADAAFDAVRSERVFQHAADPDRLLAEMIRVTRPGGWVVVGDADHTTVSIDADDMDLEWRVRQVRAFSFAHGAIGRRLPRMFESAGLQDVTIEAIPLKLRDGQLCRSAFNFDRLEGPALGAGLSPADIDRWRAVFQQPHFFATGLYFLVAGRISSAAL
jgi:ubiquinone/menaquinone biosynthesis C-methylase UbiE